MVNWPLMTLPTPPKVPALFTFAFKVLPTSTSVFPDGFVTVPVPEIVESVNPIHTEPAWGCGIVQSELMFH